MAQLVRPLRHWPRFHHHPHHNLSSFLFSPSPSLSETASLRHLFGRVVSVPAAHRTVHHHSRGLRFPNSPPRPPPFDLRHGGGDFSDSDADSWKSRNQKKRDARRAVRWGMELASFPNSQIKRILRVASLEQEVFDALMLVKKLGPDVREGKRRQFNYIGKLLREVEPELMDALIQATKDGDQSRLQELSVSELGLVEEKKMMMMTTKILKQRTRMMRRSVLSM